MLRDRRGVFEKPRSLYIHIPFCVSRCSYCDFHSFVRSSIPARQQELYVERLLERVENLCGALSVQELTTIYIGGGTPTALDDGNFRRLIHGLDAMFGSSITEWTVEANPESLTEEKLGTLLAHHVNRISIGIQSMDEAELGIMGRPGSVADNRRAIGMAAGTGLSVSADLIAALPRPRGEKPGREGKPGGPPRSEVLLDAAAFLADAGVRHISLYDLVAEEGTPIQKLLAEGKYEAADEDDAYFLRKKAESLLRARGYERYEVSNYAIPGHESLHNQTYWAMNSYLGVGSGAVSTLNRLDASPGDPERPAALRIEEGRDFGSYLKDPDSIMTLYELSPRDSAFETLMMGLRTRRGVDEKRFESRFGLVPSEFLQNTMKKWESHFSVADGFLGLGDAGLDILNRILIDVLGDIDSVFGFSR